MACAVLGLEATVGAEKAAATEGVAKMQGNWQLVSAQLDGLPLPEDMAEIWKGTANSNEVRVTIAGELFFQATFSVDPSKRPMAVDYDITGGPLAGQRQLGIYELSAQGATFCVALPGQPRPTEFKTDPTSGRTLSAWVKAKK